MTQPIDIPLVTHATGDWQKWRKVVEENMDTATVEQKSHYNVWDHVKTVIEVLKRAKNGTWIWWKNSRCKYIDVRIDMRDGGCIIKNKDGKRINPSDLEFQHGE